MYNKISACSGIELMPEPHEIEGLRDIIKTSNKTTLYKVISNRNEKGETPLHFPGIHCDFLSLKKVVKKLDIDQLYKIFQVHEIFYSYTILHLLFRNISCNFLDDFIDILFNKLGAEKTSILLQQKNHLKQTPLHLASIAQNIDTLKNLYIKLNEKFDINQFHEILLIQDSNGRTALHKSVIHKKLDIIDIVLNAYKLKHNMLIELLEQRDKSNSCVFSLSMQFNNNDIVNKLLTTGVQFLFTEKIFCQNDSNLKISLKSHKENIINLFEGLYSSFPINNILNNHKNLDCAIKSISPKCVQSLYPNAEAKVYESFTISMNELLLFYNSICTSNIQLYDDKKSIFHTFLCCHKLQKYDKIPKSILMYKIIPYFLLPSNKCFAALGKHD